MTARTDNRCKLFHELVAYWMCLLQVSRFQSDYFWARMNWHQPTAISTTNLVWSIIWISFLLMKRIGGTLSSKKLQYIVLQKILDSSDYDFVFLEYNITPYQAQYSEWDPASWDLLRWHFVWWLSKPLIADKVTLQLYNEQCIMVPLLLLSGW